MINSSGADVIFSIRDQRARARSKRDSESNAANNSEGCEESELHCEYGEAKQLQSKAKTIEEQRPR